MLGTHIKSQQNYQGKQMSQSHAVVINTNEVTINDFHWGGDYGVDDNKLCSYRIEGIDEEFRCIPSQTSNFEVFCLSNPQLTRTKATKIWDYYRDLFISAKLSGLDLTPFRVQLENFVYNKRFDKTADATHSIKRYIGIARWMELQYNIDTTIDEINKRMSVEDINESASRVLGTVPYNNYISYFSKDIESKIKDPAAYDTRKLTVRSKFKYNHKQLRWYVCESEVGAVKLWVNTKHNPFIDMFEKMIDKGVTINVVTSKILLNINENTAHIKVDNFFLEE